MNKIKLGYYKHYKGGLYQVLYEAKNVNNDLEEVVVYQNVHEPSKVWVRTVRDFLYPAIKDGVHYERFEYLGDTLTDWSI